MQGQIIKIVSDLHVVSCDNVEYPCKCRGIFRKEHIIPLVGDYVLFDKNKMLIEKILPRKNQLERPKVSNIDQAFIITSLVQPDFSLSLLDKLITLMEINNIDPIICITKEDLLDNDGKKIIYEKLEYYKRLGYKVVSNKNISEISKLLDGKTSAFTGQTGSGKSTLLNSLNPSWNLDTGEISIALGRGRHTTRVVSLFTFLNGKVMDTPGFSSLEFKNIPKDKIRNSFREFSKYPCPFSDCTHTKEKECEVKKAVISNNIMKSRYDNYLKFIGEENNEG